MITYKVTAITFFKTYHIEVEADTMEIAESIVRENGGIWGINSNVIGIIIEKK